MTIASNQPRIRADVVLDVLARQERDQAWLSRRMGVSRSLVTRVLKGERPATPAFRARLSRALDLPEIVLFMEMPMHIDTSTSAVA
jgi:transcriptional regulator with XRE-family HTH domain